MVWKKLVGLLIAMSLCVCLAQGVYASKYHEDPEDAPETFSGLTLLVYYSDILDGILSSRNPADFDPADINPADVKEIILKMSYAYVPSSLDDTITGLIDSSLALTDSAVRLYTDLKDFRRLISISSFDEAEIVRGRINKSLQGTRKNLHSVRLSINEVGDFLEIDKLDPENELSRAYRHILNQLDLLDRMLYSLEDSLTELEETREKLSPTAIQIKVDPPAVYVGDEIRITGKLDSQGAGLDNRDVDILVDGNRSSTLRTAAGGIFDTSITVPYNYVSSLTVQAGYAPRGADGSIYLGSTSQQVFVDVNFYTAGISLDVTGTQYPGTDSWISGKVDYGSGPPLDKRRAELYMDEVLTGILTLDAEFTRKLSIRPDAVPGKHTLLVSSAASGRYAPIRQAFPLEVTKAATELDLELGGVALIPSSISVNGVLKSDTGWLNNAIISLNAGDKTYLAKSNSEGKFETKIPMGLSLSLVKKQKIEVSISPSEPWNSDLTVSRSVFVINLPNLALLLVLLAAAVYYLPRRSKEILGVLRSKFKKPALPAGMKQGNKGSVSQDPERNPLVVLYRYVLKTVQSLTHKIIKPQQTLREYAVENRPRLGKISRYFYQLTLLAERAIYSRNSTGINELKQGKQLVQAMQRTIKDEAGHDKN